MDEIKVVTLKNGQVILGKVVKNETGKIIGITSPRAIMPVQGNRLQIIELFGSPDEIKICDDPVYFADLQNKELFKAYIKATTNLTLAN